MEVGDCYGEVGGRRRRKTVTPRCELHDDQDDLLFDLEYDECDRRRRSASADSFHSRHGGYSGQGHAGNGGGASTGPRYDTETEDQETAQVRRVRSFKLRQEEWYGSLPGHHNSRHRRQMPLLDPGDDIPVREPHPYTTAAYSVPAQHHGHWRHGDQGDQGTPDLVSPSQLSASSLSSVEEAVDYQLRPTFNHLDIDDHHNIVSKSPKFLPKFLRASFSKLLKDKPSKGESLKREGGYLRTMAVSTPVSRSPSINFDNDGCDQRMIPYQDTKITVETFTPDYSPTTGEFIQDCINKGLPIIPFNYSTAEIVEKQRQRQRHKTSDSKGHDEGLAGTRDRSAAEWSSNRLENEDKSLAGLLTLARREMEQEAQLRKISGITGYAANNSRALQRRRSSVSEYVTQDEDEETHTTPRVRKLRKHVMRLATPGSDQSEDRSRDPASQRLRKHVLRQESYEERSPQYYFDHSDVVGCSGVRGCRNVISTRRAASLDQYLDMNCTIKDFV